MSYSVLLSVALPFPKCYAKRGGNHANANRKIACVAGLRRQRGGNNGLYIVINRIIYLPVAANSAYAVDKIMLVFVKLIFAAIELALVPMSVFIVLPIALRFVYYVSAFAYTVDKSMRFNPTHVTFIIVILVRTGAIMIFLIVLIVDIELYRIVPIVFMLLKAAFAHVVTIKFMIFKIAYCKATLYLALFPMSYFVT